MDLNQLKTFYVLGKVGSFTETAKQMYVSQSAISHSIKKLENTTGTKLLTRKGRHLSLTTAGKELFKTCETIFFEIEKAKENIESYKKKFSGEINIGSPVEFGSTILIRHMKNFLVNNPGLKVDFYLSNDLSKLLLIEEVDFIIDCKEHFLPNIEKIKLFQEQYVVIASPEFVKHNKIHAIADLERIPGQAI